LRYLAKCLAVGKRCEGDQGRGFASMKLDRPPQVVVSVRRLQLSGETSEVVYWLSPTPHGAIIFASSAQGWPRLENAKPMKKTKSRSAASGMGAEYDFRGGVRGRYARRYARGLEQGSWLVLMAMKIAL
jgi:hypothetical protein